MNKITFKHDGFIYQNGVVVGELCGSKEVYVVLYTPSQQVEVTEFEREHGFYPNNRGEVVARFKYKKPKFCAKAFVRFALTKHTAQEVIDGCRSSTPMEWAESKGYNVL